MGKAAPNRPLPAKTIEEDQLVKHIGRKEMPNDVLSIQCNLGEFLTSCRGLSIWLYDLAGTEIARAHTGTIGLVGFEGLKRGHDYVARIVSDKYQGEIQVRPGRSYNMVGKSK